MSDYPSAIYNMRKMEYLLKTHNYKQIYFKRRFSLILFQWGQVLLDQNRVDEAFQNFVACQELGLWSPKLYLKLAICKVLKLKITDAIAYLDTMLQLLPKSADALIFRAKLYRVREDPFSCFSDLQQVTAIEPKHPELNRLFEYVYSCAALYKNKTVEFTNKKEFNIALYFANNAIKLDPNDWRTLFNRGVLLVKTAEYTKGLEDLMLVLNHESREKEKQQDIKKAISHTYNLLATACFEKNEFDEAIKNLTTAIEFNQLDPLIFKNRAECYCNINDFESALSDLESAKALNKDDDTMTKIAKVYEKLATAAKNPGMAIMYLGKAIEHDPNISTLYFERGRAYFGMGEIENCQIDLIKSLELDPSNVNTQGLISLLTNTTMMAECKPWPKHEPEFVKRLKHSDSTTTSERREDDLKLLAVCKKEISRKGENKAVQSFHVHKETTANSRSIPQQNQERTSIASSVFISILRDVAIYAKTSKRDTGFGEKVIMIEISLAEFGYRVGLRYNELLGLRERNVKRETKVLSILYFINSNLWKALFGKQADSLEKSTENDDEYMISDNDPIISKFISVPKEISSLNCGSFVAGIIEAVLDSSQFPSRVTAHSTGNEQFPNRTTLLIKFSKDVMLRESME